MARIIATAISTICSRRLRRRLWHASLVRVYRQHGVHTEHCPGTGPGRGWNQFRDHANHFWRNQDVGWQRRGCICVSGAGRDMRGVCGGLGLAKQPSVRSQSRHRGGRHLDGFPILLAIRAGVARAADSVAGNGGFREGFLPYEKAVLAVAWIVPRVSLPVSQSAKIPIAPIVIIALPTAILRRASYREPTAHQQQAIHLGGFRDTGIGGPARTRAVVLRVQLGT